MADKPKRKLSEAELRQRRAAGRKRRNVAPEVKAKRAAACTGPRTPEGKASSSLNSWKHGLRSKGQARLAELGLVWQTGKPCRTTCPQYPCQLVQKELTKPGGDCLDKSVYLEMFDALIATFESGKLDQMHGPLAMHMAGALETLQDLRSEIAAKGFLVSRPLVDREGNLVCDPETDKPIVGEYRANPALPHYIKLLDTLGINLAELMATPRAVSKLSDEDDKVDEVAGMIGTALSRVGLATRRPVTIDAKAETEGE